MLIKINYSLDGRMEKLIKQKNIIPYRVFPNEKYKANRWYYSYFYNEIFKVEEVSYNEDGSLSGAYIKSDENTHSYITTELDIDDYAVYKDRRNIRSMNIINHEESFTGAEIIYWFFMNDITALDPKYEGFWKYIDRYSIDRINDRSRYFVRAKLIGNKYTDCKLEIDDALARKVKQMSDKIHKVSSDKFMAELKYNDMRRMSEKHRIEI